MKKIWLISKNDAYAMGFCLFAVILMVILAANKPIMRQPFIFIFSIIMIVMFAMAFAEEFIQITFKSRSFLVSHYLGFKKNKYEYKLYQLKFDRVQSKGFREIYWVSVTDKKGDTEYENIKCDEDHFIAIANLWNKGNYGNTIDAQKIIKDYEIKKRKKAR